MTTTTDGRVIKCKMCGTTNPHKVPSYTQAWTCNDCWMKVGTPKPTDPNSPEPAPKPVIPEPTKVRVVNKSGETRAQMFDRLYKEGLRDPKEIGSKMSVEFPDLKPASLSGFAYARKQYIESKKGESK